MNTLVKIHPEQSKREQLHALFSKLPMVCKIGFCHMYQKYALSLDSSASDIIDNIPDNKIHVALSQVRNELIMQECRS